MTHPCPFTLGELLALSAIARCRGNEALATKCAEHQDAHIMEADEVNRFTSANGTTGVQRTTPDPHEPQKGEK